MTTILSQFYNYYSLSQKAKHKFFTNETQRNSNHQLFEVLDTLSENVKNMKLEIKKLSDETKENRRLLGAIADQNSIYMDDDNFESVL